VAVRPSGVHPESRCPAVARLLDKRTPVSPDSCCLASYFVPSWRGSAASGDGGSQGARPIELEWLAFLLAHCWAAELPRS